MRWPTNNKRDATDEAHLPLEPNPLSSLIPSSSALTPPIHISTNPSPPAHSILTLRDGCYVSLWGKGHSLGLRIHILQSGLSCCCLNSICFPILYLTSQGQSIVDWFTFDKLPTLYLCPLQSQCCCDPHHHHLWLLHKSYTDHNIFLASRFVMFHHFKQFYPCCCLYSASSASSPHPLC